MFGWWPEESTPAMPALGSVWKHAERGFVSAVTASDIEFWSHPELGGDRLRAYYLEWEPVGKVPVLRCTCGGVAAKTTHSSWCDSNPNAPAPFRMPGKLSF